MPEPDRRETWGSRPVDTTTKPKLCTGILLIGYTTSISSDEVAVLLHLRLLERAERSRVVDVQLAVGDVTGKGP